jgi:hypothetical protein
MNIISKFVTAIISGMLISNANASIITIETGFSSTGQQIDAAAYKSAVDAAVSSPSNGYGSTIVPIYNISNHSLFSNGSSTDIAFKSTIEFYVSAANAGAWDFRAGVDFGRGGGSFY